MFLLANNLKNIISKYLFPFHYWPFVLVVITILLTLIIIFRKKIFNYLNLFSVFFKLGLFTFGGGYAMIPQLKEEVVEKAKWINDDEMLEIIAIAESTPGPIAINMATFIGYKQGKILGSLLATIGVVLPSLLVIFIISLFFDSFIANKYVAAAFVGIKACVAFLILKAGLNMLNKMKKNIFNTLIFFFILVTTVVLELTSTNFSSIILILFGGSLGIILSLFNKEKEMKKWFT